MREWISSERLSDLIAGIYDCAIDPSRWPATMEAIRVELACATASLTLASLPDLSPIVSVNTNIPEPYERIMLEAADEGVALWGGAAALGSHPMDEPAVLTSLNPAFDRQTTQNPYYHDFAKPLGLIDVMAVILARDAQALGSLGFGRHASAGPFGQREVKLARLLVPHLQRAATINRMLDMSALATASFAAIVDHLSVPVILTESDLRIDHANPAAAALFAGGAPLTSRSGRLRATQPGVEQALAVAVAAACQDAAAMGRKGLEIPARGREGESFVLHVLPLPLGGHARARGGRAAVFVGRARTGFVASEDLLSALFGLTPTEARVFKAIAAGYEVKQVAERLGVAQSTIQTHIRRLFLKTGVRRQMDLVRIAVSLAVPV
jgi:DNA-binding CsgD family transcriptional regulator